MLPAAFVEERMEGPYVGPHSADFLRGACLWRYGGVFIDVGILMVRKLDDVFWRQLEDEESPYRVSIPWLYGQNTLNFIVAARKGDPFIERWHTLFTHLWSTATSSTGMIASPLLSFNLATMSSDFTDSLTRGLKFDFAVPPATVFEYIAQTLCFKRVALLEPQASDPTGFNGVEYWEKKILLWDPMPEAWAAEKVVGFESGKRVFELLAMRTEEPGRDAPQSEKDDWKLAWEMTWTILTSVSMEKVSHGKGLTKVESLGVLWDEAERSGRDIEEGGTFAGLLRYGSVHFEQTRKGIEYVTPPVPKVTLREGLLGV